MTRHTLLATAKPLILCTCMLATPRAFGQIANVADAASRHVSDGLTAAGEVSWEKKSGNNYTSLFSGAATGYWKQGPHLTMLILRREYGEQKGVKSSDSTFEHLRYRYALTSHVDGEAFVQEDRDPFRRVGARFVAGAGPRTLLFSDKDQTVYFGLAPMYERERLDNPSVDTGERINYERSRLSVSITYDLKLDERLSLHNTGYYQPVLTEIKNRRLEDEASVAMKIAKHLDFKMTAVLAHDSRPPVGIRAFDQQYKNALEFVF